MIKSKRSNLEKHTFNTFKQINDYYLDIFKSFEYVDREKITEIEKIMHKINDYTRKLNI